MVTQDGVACEARRSKRARAALLLAVAVASAYAPDSRAQGSLAQTFSNTLTGKAEVVPESKPKASKSKSKPKSKAKSKSKPKGNAKAKPKPAAAQANPAPNSVKSAPAEPAPAGSSPVSAADGSIAPRAVPNAAAAAAPAATALPAAAPSAEVTAADALAAPAPLSAAGEAAREPPEPELAPVVAEPATSQAVPEAAATEASPLRLAMFVDAYVAFQTNDPGTLATLSGHRAFSGQGSTFLSENGFSLAFLGLDVSYVTRRFGATANLRFGEAAPIYHAHAEPESDFTFGIDLLTQAYLTWRPLDPLTIDLGMFSTPFGAEVLESWRNLNYTRGALYYYAQPAWHTGLRLQYELSDEFGLLGFVANGTNNISETQQGFGLDQTPTLGAQLRVTPVEPLTLALGGLFTVDGYNNDDAGFDGFGDLVATLDLDAFQAVFNADYILTRDATPDERDRQFWGFSLGLGYSFGEHFGLAARGEYLLDDATFDGNTEQWRLLTATLTADYKPFSDTPNLIIRWDNRWEQSNQAIFGADSQGTVDPADDTYRDVWFESVIGVVVTTAP